MEKEIAKLGEINIYAPMTGEVVPIEKVPDQVFAEKMLGDGVAIIPTRSQVVAPCNGIVGHILPTNHAIALKIGEIELLIHVGIDTIAMKGKGFKRFVEAGDEVEKGDLLLEIDLEGMEKAEKYIITPIIITSMEGIAIEKDCLGEVRAGENIIYKIKFNN